MSWKPKKTRKRYYARPRWRNPGKAWETYTRRQERRQRMPKAFTTRAQWRYGANRTEAREERLKDTAGRLMALGNVLMRLTRWIFPEYDPGRIDKDRYLVDGGD